MRAESGFFEEAFQAALDGKPIANIIAARLTPLLQRALDRWALAPGLEPRPSAYRGASINYPKKAPGKTLPLFTDDPNIQGWRYSAFATTLDIPAVEVWRNYRGRADCENRIKELKADFGLAALNLRDFWATEAALGFTMLAYYLISLFRQAVLRNRPF